MPTTARNAQDDEANAIKHLRAAVDRSGYSLAEIERRCTWPRGYLTDLLRGRKILRYGQIVTVVRAVGEDPAEFFARLFPAPLPDAFLGRPISREDLLREVDAAVERAMRGRTEKSTRGAAGQRGR